HFHKCNHSSTLRFPAVRRPVRCHGKSCLRQLPCAVCAPLFLFSPLLPVFSSLWPLSPPESSHQSLLPSDGRSGSMKSSQQSAQESVPYSRSEFSASRSASSGAFLFGFSCAWLIPVFFPLRS